MSEKTLIAELLRWPGSQPLGPAGGRSEKVHLRSGEDPGTAPLFIIHDANDPRVPLSEAEQIHAAMTARGGECELLVYGDEGHGLTKRANRADAMSRAFAFLARHLGG